MVQFYFLAVCLNILGGLILSAKYFSEKMPFLDQLKSLIMDKQYGRIIFVLLLVFTGVFKILSVTKVDIPVVGDLLPALSLFLLAALFSVDFLADRSQAEGTLIHRMEDFLVPYSRLIGVAAVVIGVLHFIFPAVLFL